MFICSHITGNDCKPIATEIEEFNKYHECARHGYKAASELMGNFSKEFIDEYRTYIVFSCKEESTV